MPNRHLPHPTTAAALKKRKADKGLNQRQLAIDLGYSESYHATLSGVMREKPGSISAEAEKVLRQRLGIGNRPDKRPRKRLRTDTTRYANLSNDDIHRILDEANTPPANHEGGKLALVRVWDMDECEEIAVGEYGLKDANTQAADWQSREE